MTELQTRFRIGQIQSMTDFINGDTLELEIFYTETA